MSFDTILVATDFSTLAQSALDWAIDLAVPLGARVTLAHVYDLPLVGLPDATLMVSAETAARLSDDAQAALNAEVARVSNRGVPVEGILRQGDPRDLISSVAAEARASFIVVGSHGRRGVARALLGSVAEDVLRRSAIPVAVVRRQV
jgi:nucleotide-binding universal stress UspA family protein